jgi:beta-ribofuranosylaminobenzene 5'-phosphate synthase
VTESSNDDACESNFKCVSVTTGSRLHFGLLRTSHPYGGLGVMIDSPQTRVSVSPAERFTCVDASAIDGETIERATRIAERFAAYHGLSGLPSCNITIIERPPAHSGLGSGTQLAMALSQALTRFFRKTTDPAELASEIASRGERSAVGIHGFFHGGLLFENSFEDCHQPVPTINPIASRYDVPAGWRVAVFRPRDWIATVSGDSEKEHFVRTQANPSTSLTRLMTIAQQQLLPAVRDGDFNTFADAVQRFNQESGLLFESIQGGPYNGPIISSLVERLKSLGAVGIGQSSWGPSVFCWLESEAAATELLARVPKEQADGFITSARNAPHQVHEQSP